MSDVRKLLAEAKADIEKKAGYKFSRDYLALADLISEFVAIKVHSNMGDLKEEIKPVQSVGQVVSKPLDDSLYALP